MNQLKENNVVETLINKSRFIASAYIINDQKEAEELIKKLKIQYKDASHNCSAYIVGPISKVSDDGEPSKTAGMPMLEVLNHHDLDNILVVVTRYFGGIKLGSGGLIRAYAKSVSNLIEQSAIEEMVEKRQLELTCSQNNVTYLKRLFEDNKIEVISSEFAYKVIYKVLVPEVDVDKFINLINSYDHSIIIKNK